MIMASLRSYWQLIQNSIWLTCAVVCLFFALVFWAITDKDELIEIVKEPETEVEIQIQPEKVAATTHLGALLEQVKPLEMTTRLTASGTHEAEFRGTKFVTENKDNSTVELFRAVEEGVVKGFIRKQTQRDNLIYIRLSGENQKEQYVVLYGNFRNSNVAANELKQLNLKAPASLKPSVHTFSEYLPFVNDLGSEELGVNSQLHEVNLAPAAIPRIVVPVAPRVSPKSQQESASSEHSTTSTTVTRRDAQGNVVDVKRSQTEVENSPNQSE
jgi:hypothetical protein